VDLSRFDEVLWVASAALAAAIIARILQQRLFQSPLKSFAWMLGVVLVRDATLSIPRYNTHAYAVIWEWTLPALLAAQLWAGFDTLRVRVD
jgi:ABC-type transport system involved in cytochrome bd biosynthesis fused ATPase/permease subunit